MTNHLLANNHLRKLMTKPIKERAVIKSPNYPRFYQFKSSICRICSECPANTGTSHWSDVAKKILGNPVHTNWPEDINTIDIVYICESPSNRENSHDLPSVGITGQGIYKNECGSLVDYWLDKLDEKIYRTNIVRCQADAGLQKRVDDTKKNQRVREAFDGYCKFHLRNELKLIFQKHTSCNNKIKFVVAIGDGFPSQTKNTKAIIEELAGNYSLSNNIEIIERNHPSYE